MQQKILFVTRNLSGGGAERVISNLANHFSVNGYDVTLVCLDESEIKYNVAPTVKVKSLVNRKYKENHVTRVYYALLTFIKLMQVLRTGNPLITISFITSVNVWTGLCCWLLNKTYIVSERTSPHFSLERLNKLSRWLTYKIYSKAKFVVLPSKRMLETYYGIQHFRNLNNFATIYNPIQVFPEPSTESVHNKAFILAVGRLNNNKRFDLLIDAFDEVKDTDVDLLISGVGAHKAVLEQKVDDLGLRSSVHFIGFKRNIQDYYAQAKLFVSTSMIEGYPNALVESLGHGCPVIATDCEFGPSEIIEHGENGFLVPLNDKQELVNAIATVLKDEQLSARFSKNAMRINDSNSIDNIAQQWNNLIQS